MNAIAVAGATKHSRINPPHPIMLHPIHICCALAAQPCAALSPLSILSSVSVVSFTTSMISNPPCVNSRGRSLLVLLRTFLKSHLANAVADSTARTVHADENRLSLARRK